MRFEISRRASDSWVAQVVIDDGTVGLVGHPHPDVERCVRSVEAIVEALRDERRIVRPSEGEYEFRLVDGRGGALAELVRRGADDAAGRLAALRQWARAESQFRVVMADEPGVRRRRAAKTVRTAKAAKTAKTTKQRSAAPAPSYPQALVNAMGAPGFEMVAGPSGRIHFRFNDADGRAQLLSRGYTSTRRCEAGVRAVTAAGSLRARYRVHLAKRCHFSVRAANGRELARSRPLDRDVIEATILATMDGLIASALRSRLVTVPVQVEVVTSDDAARAGEATGEGAAVHGEVGLVAVSDGAAVEAAESRARRAHEVVRRHAMLAAGLGLVPIPWFDVIALTAVQVAMIEELARLHGAAFSSVHARAAIAALLVGVGSVSMAGVLANGLWRLVPGLGALFGAVGVSTLGGGLTLALGRVFTAHFESGGTVLTFDASRVRPRFKSELDAGLRA